MKQRVITALVGVPLIAAATWFGNPWYPSLITIIALLAVHEFYRMARSRAAPLLYWGLAWTLTLVLIPLWPLYDKNASASLFVIAAMVISSLSWLVFRRQKEEAIHNWAWTMAGTLYIGFLLSLLVALRGHEQGLGWAFVAIFGAFAADTSALFAGRGLGKHRLVPTISPGKTWEGMIAGLLGALLASLLLVSAFKLPLNYVQILLLGLLVGVAAVLGDLTESLLKRNLSVKDSNRWLPGHGGILDSFDSVIFSGAAVYLYVIGLELLA
jgi:phosphatidate cytidylyltransferase